MVQTVITNAAQTAIAVTYKMEPVSLNVSLYGKEKHAKNGIKKKDYLNVYAYTFDEK